MNKVIFAAAGNGKTYSICLKAREAIQRGDKYVLLISYTIEGVKSLEREYRKQNDGFLDKRIVILTWYSFLLCDLIRPYQSLVKLKYNKNIDFLSENFVKSIAFYETEQPPRYSSSDRRYFFNGNNDIRKDRVSHLAYLCNEHSDGKAIERMEQLYSHIFIDELQDYAGWDLDIITLLFNSQIDLLCVGDCQQATYRTNNSRKNSKYRDEKIQSFFLHLKNKGLCCIEYDNATRRLNSEICNFVNTINDERSLDIYSVVSSGGGGDHEGVFFIEYEYLDSYFYRYRPTILRYNKNTSIPIEHDCDIFTYGNSKGVTYERVVIFPISTVLPFITKGVKIKSGQTRAKFYVACTRAKYSVVFAVEKINILDYSIKLDEYILNDDLKLYKFII